jgi:hypothetical protein
MQHASNHASDSVVTFFVAVLILVHHSRLRNFALQLFHEDIRPGGNGFNGSISMIPFVVNILKVILKDPNHISAGEKIVGTNIFSFYPPKDHDGWKRVDTILGAKLIRVICSAVYFGQHQSRVSLVRLNEIRVGFLPNRLKFLAPVTPRSEKIHNHNLQTIKRTHPSSPRLHKVQRGFLVCIEGLPYLMLQARSLETCGVQQ